MGYFAVAWVFRWTSSLPPPLLDPPSHLQLFVSLRYRKCGGVCGSFAVYAILLMLYVPFLVKFLPMPLPVAWVNRWTFSPPPPPSPPSSHLQLFVSLRYRKRRGVCRSFTVYAILLMLYVPILVDFFKKQLHEGTSNVLQGGAAECGQIPHIFWDSSQLMFGVRQSSSRSTERILRFSKHNKCPHVLV